MLVLESDSWVHIRVPVDAIVMTSSEMEISELIGLFRLSLCRALKAVGMETERSLKVKQLLFVCPSLCTSIRLFVHLLSVDSYM